MKRRLARLWNGIKILIVTCMEDNVSLYAAQASFFLIISSIPFLMFILSIVRYIFPLNVGEMIDFLSSVFPKDLAGLFTTLIYEIYPKSASAPLMSVTALTAFWSSSRGLMALRTGLNGISVTSEDGNYVTNRLSALLYTAALMVLILATLILFAFGNAVLGFARNHEAKTFVMIFSAIMQNRLLMVGLLLAGYFVLIYSLFPRTKSQFRANLPGAFFSAAGWILFSYAYGYYIDNFSSYSYVYGSLTAVVLLMLWVYFCMNILLIGAEINELAAKRHKNKNASEEGKRK